MTRRSLFAIALAPLLPKRTFNALHVDCGFGGNQSATFTMLTGNLRIIGGKWTVTRRWEEPSNHP